MTNDFDQSSPEKDAKSDLLSSLARAGNLSPAQRKLGKHAQIQEAITSIVKGLPKGTHLTASQVFEKAQEKGLDVSLSTIYRNLHRLKADGNVSTVSGDRGLRYEAAEEGPDHDHLICLGCGLTIEFVDDLIRGFGKSVAQRKGFEHKSSRFDILGFCGQCRAKDDGYLMRQSVDSLLSAVENLEESVANLRHAIELIEVRKQNKALPIVNVSLNGLKNALDQTEKAQSFMKRIGGESS